MNIHDRLAALELELAALKKAAGNDPRAAFVADQHEQGPRVTELLEERTTDLPNLKEMQRLYAAVKHKSPWPQALNGRHDENRPFRAFSSCFRWLQNIGRLEQPNKKVSLAYWCDACRLWLRARNCVGSDVDANALILAVYAAGDVPYLLPDDRLGNVWELGLAQYGGKPASAAAWRRVMQVGSTMPPAPPDRRFAPPSPARIYEVGR
jgi:hypothetical protein